MYGRQLRRKAAKSSRIAPINGRAEALAALKRLRRLRLANLRTLTSLAGLGQLEQLEDLEIQGCRRIQSIGEIAALHRLRKLNLSDGGQIESLRPLEHLAQLESVMFYGSTNISDGDLSPLLELKKLSAISFQNRRHYSHRREDVRAVYPR